MEFDFGKYKDLAGDEKFKYFCEGLKETNLILQEYLEQVTKLKQENKELKEKLAMYENEQVDKDTLKKWVRESLEEIKKEKNPLNI